MTEEQKVLNFLKKGGEKNGYETNFVVQKFLQLSAQEQAEFFEKINSADEKISAEAAKELLNFVLDNLKEMGQFVDPAINVWLILPNDAPYKAYYLWLYFKTHLKKSHEEQFSIQPIAA